ncbi:3-hydroxyacyl-CoA dehydrogenase / enoyl-CoA hydratase / 3-hydroxybutyryl-CoA epimerase [Dethiosulfatibacter aminovorans DSM 17477]|uniref:enoyl-CoA hydratase n=1 Tax=Dethiosulfatibacter aminovorans DSM 17477 TaxID=1121476 RepID=A0A1M6EY54_9FIRM|nr:3-hydroxyacyl-CoA dehydrogenase NAD-binding domain-containing protein [Dethiosulfatibacter aminovorans]SHI90350.1 3-hydroxyacyl-CoA dehydrogenase / enoyl-CoA hydratase / 3-hydroxybutyryl-CoA epimerase [Dethiosulfatibacter aminovorans DSM 17477]
MSNKMFSYVLDGEIAVITFDEVGNKMNTWSNEAFDSFTEVIEEVKALADKKEIKGAVIISGKPYTFLAGADLNVLVQATESRETCKNDISSMHEIFNALADVSVPTLAAINGHCLGGGLEFALACDARIAKKSKTTVLGLPEIGVGVFPAGGGTSRLLRLIGTPAIDLVLKSKNLGADEALKLGVVDKCVEEDADLLDEAKTFLNEICDKKVVLNRVEHDFSNIDEVVEEARKGVMKKARGRLLPAPKGYLQVVQEGANLPLEESLELEKKQYVDVATSNETKGSINTFMLTSFGADAKKFITKGYEPRTIKKAAVLGFGTMGRGIVIDVINRANIPVVVKDRAEAFEPGMAFVEKILTGMHKKGRLKGEVADYMNLIIPVTEYTDDFKDVDIVVEAVFEDIKVKEQVYSELCEVISDDCILASNTSYLSVDELANMVKNPERFVGMHFFSPVWLMKLIEVIKSNQTSQNIVDDTLGFVATLRKRPVICNDGPGFVVNAVLDPFMSGGITYLDEGNRIETIDTAMVKFGNAVGPIRLMDEVGIDVSHHIFTSRNLGFKTVENMYNAGRYGLKKNGKGFYKVDGTPDEEVYELVDKKEEVIRTEEEIAMEILTNQVKEGKRILDANIVDDVRMIDMGMIFGTGYPTDKGGPMKWSDIIGLSEKLYGEKFYK